MAPTAPSSFFVSDATWCEGGGREGRSGGDRGCVVEEVLVDVW